MDNAFPPMAERPPFDVSPEDLEEEGQEDDFSPVVVEVMRVCRDIGLGFHDLLDLSICALAEASAELTADMTGEEVAADPTLVATLERLAIAAQVVGGVDFEDEDEDDEEGDDDDGEGDDEDAPEDELT